VKIERIYIAGYKLDLQFTQCCVASIRRWYPRIPISLIKDESSGPYSTEELEKYWDVKCFKTDRKIFGLGMGKLEPLLLPTKERCLILDSDIVFIGKVLDVLEEYDEDFIVADTPNPPEEIAKYYFDLLKLGKLDPDFIFPNYTFNGGQIIATTGILKQEDFEPLIRFSEPPSLIYPDIFAVGEQGLLNYVLMKKLQEGRISLRREPFMWWAGWLSEKTVKVRKLTKNSPYPFLVHWAGPKNNTSFGNIRNSHILRHFESYYYSRIPNGRFKRIGRTIRRFVRAASDRLLNRKSIGRGC
jgi:lipopolysaccharide biosynthesis glycosyltransferase